MGLREKLAELAANFQSGTGKLDRRARAALAEAKIPVPEGHTVDALGHYFSDAMAMSPPTPFDVAEDEERKKPENVLKQIAMMVAFHHAGKAYGNAFAGRNVGSKVAMFPTPEESMENMSNDAVLRDHLESRDAAPIEPPSIEAMQKHLPENNRSPTYVRPLFSELSPREAAADAAQDRTEAAEASNIDKHLSGRAYTDFGDVADESVPIGTTRGARGEHIVGSVEDSPVPPSKNLPGQQGLEEFWNALNKKRSR